MQLSCPNCATSYEVNATTLGEAGRSVRCTRCRTVWQAAATPLQLVVEATAPQTDAAIALFQGELGTAVHSGPASGGPAPDGAAAPAGTETPATPDIETAAAAANIADQPVDLAVIAKAQPPDPAQPDDAPPLVPQSPDGEPPAGPAVANIELLANQRRRRPTRRPAPAKPQRSRALAVIMVLLAIVGALIGFRAEVVRRAPQMASLYAAIHMPVNLRKLTFSDVRIAKETHEGVPLLLVEGTIVSTSSTPIDVPRLRFAVRNSNGSEVYTWTALPSQSKLAPFDSLAFQSRVAAPPEDARDVVVRFFNRRDVVANLH